uniref:DUF2061 domain-containing protein n=1 Tax=viral metagenome TaxID=1070528 RepID=A0A6H1ZZL8_9ZZZZ
MNKSRIYNFLRQLCMIGERLSLFLMGFYLAINNIPFSIFFLFTTIIVHYIEYEFEYKIRSSVIEEQLHKHGMKDD